MKVLLMKGQGALSMMIRWQTRSCYSHAALEDDDGVIVESWQGAGVREKLLPDRRNVDTFLVHGTTQSVGRKVMAFARAQIGAGYDYRGALRFVTRRSAAMNGKWFCSELVFASLQDAGINLLERIPPWAVSPGLLALSPLLRKEDTP